MRRLREVPVRPSLVHEYIYFLHFLTSILRAFLVEEAKIVKKVIKSQQKTASARK
jgi:hypothetical protein